VAAKGIAATRIDDVVGEAGFTRGAFYSNYSSLQEVLTEAIVARANALMERVTAAVETMEAPTMESLMEMLDSIRPEARAIHLLTSEYTLYRLRHPDSPQMAAGREEAAITALLDNKHLRTCIALGATPTDLAAEWTRYHPGITAKEVDAIIEAGEIDPRTATR